MAFRFVHASDLHLGRRFASIAEPPDGNLRGRLMEARHTVIARVAAVAQARGAGHVLLAGDTFDTATPSPGIVRQALAAMGEAAGITWWLLPGNHDNLGEAEPLWERIGREAPGNVRAILSPEPVAMEAGATLLPCPVAWRSAGADPTADLPGRVSPGGDLRIGLAHGGVTDFDDRGDTIPPDRDRSAGLDYLALGDWHGARAIGPRVQYSGTPEQDRYRHGARGVCLAVEIAAPGAVPDIAAVETGAFLWTERALALTPRQDAAAALAGMLPEAGRRDILLRIRATGWAGIETRLALTEAVEAAAPDFAHLALDDADLGTEFETADLDEIDREGALRLAAERLRQAAAATGGDMEARARAGDALARLFAYMREERR